MSEEELRSLLEGFQRENVARHEETRQGFAEMRQQFGKIDQRFDQIDQKFDLVDERFGQIDQRFDLVDERFGQIDQRFDLVDQRFGQIDQRFDQVDERFRQVDQQFGQIDQRFGQVDQQFGQIDLKFKQSSEENRHYFEILTEAFKHEVQLVAEKVLAVEDELHREAADIRLEMRNGFAETQAMFKFSHAELDRRVRFLEDRDRVVGETLANVQARLDRLENDH